MKKTILALGLGLLFTVSTSSFAGTVYFSDNFNAENGGIGALNYNGFSKWTVSDGTVDLIGNGFYDFLPGNGLYLDMDGSTGDAGKITSIDFFLPVGDYFLDFDFAGNQRTDNPDRIDFQVGLGSLLNVQLTSSYSIPFTSFYSTFPSISTFSVTIAGNYTVSFEGIGGDNIGLLLDNVKIEGINAVPEPTTMLLFGAGLAGLAAIGRRRRD